ncbi:MAG TPA: HypC/HybG/HupF family hydrogenase formation chaperone [Ktedonobacterales bacterium]
MCLATPGRVIALNGALAHIEIDGRADWYNALATPELAPGDWVVTHAHMVVEIISEAAALDMLDAAAELDSLFDELAPAGAKAPRAVGASDGD